MNHISYFKSFIIATLGITALNSCVKSDDYSVPTIACTDRFPATNHALSDLPAIAKVKPAQADIIKEDYIVEAYVSSSDQSGNIYKALYVQDKPENPTQAVEIDIDGSNQYVNYPLGSKIRLNLKGLVVQATSNNVKIGTYDPDYAIGRINPNRLSDYIARVCGTEGKAVISQMVPVVFDNITDALQPQNVNKLITIKGVQFDDAELSKTFSDADKTGDRYIVDPKGNKLDLRFSNYANFSTEKISPNYVKSGDITMILSRYNTTYQAYLRDLKDLNLTKDRFTVEVTPPDTVTPPAANAAWLFKGADFENWNDFIAALDGNGVKPYVSHAVGKGMNGGNALLINTPATGSNDYVFTVRSGAGYPAAPKRITFYMNGTAAGNGLSFNVYDAASKYTPFNSGDVTGSVQLTAAITNGYGGSVDTKGKWILVALDLSTMPSVNTKAGSNIFAFKIGKSGTYNLLIDNLKIE